MSTHRRLRSCHNTTGMSLGKYVQIDLGNCLSMVYPAKFPLKTTKLALTNYEKQTHRKSHLHVKDKRVFPLLTQSQAFVSSCKSALF